MTDLQLKIQKGVPIPTTTARKGNNIELLRAMDVGDSVFFDAPISKKATRFYRVAKHIGAKVLIRKEDEGMRLWLLEKGPGAPTAAAKPQRTSTSSKAGAKTAAKKATKPTKPAAKALAKPAVKPAAKKKAKPPKTTKAPARRSSNSKVVPARIADLPVAASVVEGAGAA